MSVKEGNDMVGFVGLAAVRRQIKGACPPKSISSSHKPTHLPTHKHSLVGSGCRQAQNCLWSSGSPTVAAKNEVNIHREAGLGD